MRILEEWRSVGDPALYELLIAADAVPTVGDELEIPGLGSVRVERVFARGRHTGGPDLYAGEFLVRLDVRVHDERG